MVSLHPRERAVCAEVVARATETDFAHLIEGESGVIDLDTAHAALGLTDKIIREDEAFVAEAKEGGVHACGLIDHIAACQTCHDVGTHLLPAGLHIREFAI
jgi:formate dehydrogenase assembly factor FdhD